MDKRNFTRVLFTTRAVARSDTATHEGEIKNLSLNGVLMESPDEISIPVDTEIELEILLSRDNGDVSFKVAGILVRVEDHKMAIQFQMHKLDTDALTHLRYIVGYNTGDPEAVMKQYNDYLDRLAEKSKKE